MQTRFFFHPSWPLLYVDNHLLALYKPAGLLVQGDQTGEVSLLDLGRLWIKEEYGKLGKVFLALVHRLDRPVAGVVLFCRTSKAANRVSRQFRENTMAKTYLAVVEGIPEELSGRLVNQLERLEGRSSRVVDSPTALSQEARLRYRVLQSQASRTLIEIQLETGKHHQIRLQLAHSGCPIVGDLRYGASSPLPQKQIALFARELTLTHPTLREEITIKCPQPNGWPWPDCELDARSPPWNWVDFLPLFRRDVTTAPKP